MSFENPKENIKEISSGKAGKQKRILWVVTELYYPEETSTGYYLTKIAEGLADDFDVKVICGQPNYSAKGIRAAKREIYKNVEIFRVSGTTLNKNVIAFRLINMVSLSFSVFLKALNKFKKNQKILVVTNPPSLPFITAFAGLFKKSKYILLIHDNYPEILIAAEKTKADSILVKFLNVCNRWLYKNAARIIVVGRDMKQLVSGKLSSLETSAVPPVKIIPNWAELEQVEPAAKIENILLKELNLSDKFIFLYAGNMGYPNDLKSFVQCAEKLLENDRIHFIFLGAGVKRNWLENEIAEKKLVNITLLNPKPRSEQIIFLNACDVALISLVKNMWGVSMPSRTYNILAAGKPILALTEKNSELDQVIEEDKVGWSVRPQNPEMLLETILEIYGNRENLVEMGRRARNSAIEKYSLNDAVLRYKNELQDASDNEITNLMG